MADESLVTAPAERRSFVRTTASLRVSYRSVGETFLDPLRDLSPGGAFVHTRTPLPLGTKLSLAFDDGGPDVLLVDGQVVRVVWSGRSHGELMMPGMAVSFLDVTPRVHARLKALIDRCR
ncbi:MAG: PilZ domain-containing protein [Myxococcota bacterium]